MPLINIVVRNKCKNDYRSSNATNVTAKRKQFQYLKFMFSLFHVHVSPFAGTLRTNIMTSSRLLPIGLPALWDKALCHNYKNPNPLSHGVFGTNYKMSTMSARSWRSGLWTVYRRTTSCGSLSCSCYILASHAGVFRGARFSSLPTGRDEKRAVISTQFPLPLPAPNPRPWTVVSVLVKTCVGHNTAESQLWKSGLIFSLKTAQTRKEKKDERLALPWSVFCR